MSENVNGSVKWPGLSYCIMRPGNKLYYFMNGSKYYPMHNEEICTCDKCGKSIPVGEGYLSQDTMLGFKHPNLYICKDCFHVKVFNPDSSYWVEIHDEDISAAIHAVNENDASVDIDVDGTSYDSWYEHQYRSDKREHISLEEAYKHVYSLRKDYLKGSNRLSSLKHNEEACNCKICNKPLKAGEGYPEICKEHLLEFLQEKEAEILVYVSYYISEEHGNIPVMASLRKNKKKKTLVVHIEKESTGPYDHCKCSADFPPGIYAGSDYKFPIEDFEKAYDFLYKLHQFYTKC